MMGTSELRSYQVHSHQRGYRDIWNEVLTAEFAGKQFSPLDNDNFRASVRCFSVDGSLMLAHARSNAARIQHEQSHLVKQDQREFIIHYQMSGTSLNMQAGREARLQPGDFTFCDTGRPYSIQFNEPTDVLVLRLRQDQLVNRLGSLDDLVAVPVSKCNPGAALFSNFIETFWDRAEAGAWQDVDLGLEDAMICLLQLAYRPVIAEQMADRSVHARHWTTAVQFIGENLSHSDLNLAALACHMRVSPRYVQSLFAQRGETLTSYVQAQRLECAARLLTNPGFGHESILGICLDCGFNDLSYFTRQFRKRFGMPPARFRAAHLSQ